MSLMEVIFTDDTSAIYTADYSRALSFLNKEVIVELRDDVYHGTIRKFISTLTQTTVTNVLSRESNLKLFAEDSREIFSTIAWGDITEAGATGALLFCTNVQFEKSDKAYWAKLTCLDRNRQSAIVRLFSPERDSANYNGRYIKMTLKKSKNYFNATRVELEQGMAPAVNPEIQIAKTFILDVLRPYEDIIQYLEKTRLLEYIERYNLDEDIEPGYEMVRLAMEVEMIDNLKNVTNQLNIGAMLKHAVIGRSYCITNDGKIVKSKRLQNLYMAIEHKVIKSALDMCLLDPENERVVPERGILESFHNLASQLALVNRTYFHDRIK